MNKISAGEYSDLLSKNKMLHLDSISMLNEYIKMVNSLIAKDGGLNDDLILSRIRLLSGRIEGEILPILSDAFKEAVQAQKLLAREITDEDEKGGGKSGWLR